MVYSLSVYKALCHNYNHGAEVKGKVKGKFAWYSGSNTLA